MPETPQTLEPALNRREKELLLQKMYTLEHWIAVIRLFAHSTLAMEDARGKIKPIAERYGKEPVADACEALVEIIPGTKPVARLKSHIRRMAFQIIGPEPAVQESEPPAPTKPPKSKPDNASEARQVKQPRHFVLAKYEAWLQAQGLSFVAAKDVKKTTPAVAPHLGGLDFIVLRGDEKLLVTVRPHVQAKHVAALAELHKLFGQEYRPIRLWPVDDPDGWLWQEHEIGR